MKISQEKVEYKPISIILETRKDAKIFISLIDKITDAIMYEKSVIISSDEQKRMINKISDSFTNLEVKY